VCWLRSYHTKTWSAATKIKPTKINTYFIIILLVAVSTEEKAINFLLKYGTWCAGICIFSDFGDIIDWSNSDSSPSCLIYQFFDLNSADEMQTLYDFEATINSIPLFYFRSIDYACIALSNGCSKRSFTGSHFQHWTLVVKHRC